MRAQIASYRFGRALTLLLWFLIIAAATCLVLAWPTAPSASADEEKLATQTASRESDGSRTRGYNHRTALLSSTEDPPPIPLPLHCDGVTPPGQDPPACCAFGYVYYDDVPAVGATVRIESAQGVLTTTTTYGGDSDDPYYGVALGYPPISATVGSLVTFTASYSDTTASRTWMVVESGQQVDVGLHSSVGTSYPLTNTAWTRVTTNQTIDTDPHWFPDGTRIAFTGFSNSWNRNVWTMNATDGSDQTQLTFFDVAQAGPYSSDGKRILFHQYYNDSRFDIMVMNATGTAITPVLISGYNSNADWSPDDTTIAFESGSHLTSIKHIYTMTADGSDVAQLTFDGWRNLMPAWSPDGSKIAFTSDRAGSYERERYNIWVMNADGSDPTQLTFGSYYDLRPAWSPDSAQIAFERYVPSASLQHIYRMDSDGSNITQMTSSNESSGEHEVHPAWSPDGRETAFSAELNGNGDVYVLDLLDQTAAFTATPLTGTVPLEVAFSGQSLGNVASWTWDFGDGGTSGGRHPSHIFESVGTYTVTLTVSGPGGTDTATHADYITVYSFEDVTAVANAAGTGGSHGAAWGDYDGDGYLDLYVTSFVTTATDLLFHNDGDGTFSDATTAAGLVGQQRGRAAVWGDYDNDGDLDLYVTREGGLAADLWRNNSDSTFTDVTISAGVGTTGGMSGAWGDYDRDGFLDILVTRWCETPLLYHNNGDGTFTNQSAAAGLAASGCGIGAIFGDYDEDGDSDIFLTFLYTDNVLYSNSGDGTFADVTVSAGVSGDGGGEGPAWGDYDNDGDLDLYVITDYGYANLLYQNNGNGTFSEVGIAAGVADTGIGRGAAWGDYNNDGWLDLAVLNWDGLILYRNNGNGVFSQVTAAEGLDPSASGNGLAWGDYDNDGDLDLYLTSMESANHFYRNSGGGKLVDHQNNRDAEQQIWYWRTGTSNGQWIVSDTGG